MPKQIIISDVKPIQMTISIGDEDQVGLSVRYVRLDENNEPIDGYAGVFSGELEGGMAQKALNFVKNSVKPFIGEQEGLM